MDTFQFSNTEGIPTLTLWWGLRGLMLLRATLAVAELLVRPPMPESSKVMTQTKSDTLVLQSVVGRETTSPRKTVYVDKTSKMRRMGLINKRWPGYKEEHFWHTEHEVGEEKLETEKNGGAI